MLMNRIADVFFIIAILAILTFFKTTDYVLVLNTIPYILNERIIFASFNVSYVSLICFFLTLGAIGKSAQIGFHT